MPEKSFADTDVDAGAVKDGLRGADLTTAQRLRFLAINTVPLLHVLLVALAACFPNWPVAPRIAAAAGVLYLAPPLVARLAQALLPTARGRICPGDPGFFTWWLLLNVQALFCRLPFLEEFLRLVPGVYSNWLRLWGVNIGRLTYWAPGTTILDRTLIEIGDDVVFGMGVRLNPHVMVKGENGGYELILDRVRIGDRCLVGGYALITAGSEVVDDETLQSHAVLPPYSTWIEGRRQKRAEPDSSAP